MKKEIFKGSAVALVTPMYQDGSINYDSLKNLLDLHLKNGTDAIVTCGTTGESATLSDTEKEEIIKFTIKYVDGKIPVIVGTGSNNTSHAAELSLMAEKLGADGLLIVTPYYNKTSQKGLVAHYNYIADRINLPIITYNVPSRTGVNITPKTYLELSKHPNIVATKEANGDISSIAKTKALCGDNLAIYSGNDDQIIPVLSLGGIGVISAFANVCPKECHLINEYFMNGKTKESLKLFYKYLGLMNSLFIDVNPIPVKHALNAMGFDCGSCRLPLVELDDNSKKVLEEDMKSLGLIS